MELTAVELTAVELTAGELAAGELAAGELAAGRGQTDRRSATAPETAINAAKRQPTLRAPRSVLYRNAASGGRCRLSRRDALSIDEVDPSSEIRPTWL